MVQMDYLSNGPGLWAKEKGPGWLVGSERLLALKADVAVAPAR